MIAILKLVLLLGVLPNCKTFAGGNKVCYNSASDWESSLPQGLTCWAKHESSQWYCLDNGKIVKRSYLGLQPDGGYRETCGAMLALSGYPLLQAIKDEKPAPTVLDDMR